jgi:hypothetical protein
MPVKALNHIFLMGINLPDRRENEKRARNYVNA